MQKHKEDFKREQAFADNTTKTHRVTNNNKPSSNAASSILQEYKTFSKNFFSRQSQGGH